MGTYYLTIPTLLLPLKDEGYDTVAGHSPHLWPDSIKHNSRARGRRLLTKHEQFVDISVGFFGFCLKHFGLMRKVADVLVPNYGTMESLLGDTHIFK